MKRAVSKKSSEITDFSTGNTFEKLMSRRISEILLICNEYDAFMLEEDGRIEERIFSEYSSLHLRYPPHFNRVSSYKSALALMKKKNFDLIITLHNSRSWDAFKINSEINKKFPGKPAVVLAPFSRKILTLTDIEKKRSGSDYIFSWLGDAGILVAIIKLIEDKMNIDDDIASAGVQVIILVEDSIRYYSSYLPVIYETVFEQTLHVMSEDMNDHQKNLRMRGRPKILLATDYEQALSLIKKYKKNLLGVITDVEFERNSIHDKNAGIDLCGEIRKLDRNIPVLVNSSRVENMEKAYKFGAGFICKQTENVLIKIGLFVKNNFGFGEFCFIDPLTNKVIAKAGSLRELHKALEKIPDRSLEYHASENHFSKWLRARTLFELADIFKNKSIKDFSSIKEVRHFLISLIKSYRKSSGSGIISNFSRDFHDEMSMFSRIGEGSIGGKGRGLAFMDNVLKRKRFSYSYYGVEISIPKTIVLSTDVFSEFMKINNLFEISYSNADDGTLLKNFLESELPGWLTVELEKLIENNNYPLAVRSSSLLEDSYYQPFAGIYATYMIPNNSKDKSKRLKDLSDAVKSVYASTFYEGAKKYLKATKNVIEEEKMAVVIQRVSGEKHRMYFYPTFSGVARSINDYPVGYEDHNISIVNVAAGLGKTIVDSEISLRYSPSFPNNVIQFSSAEFALKFTQKEFYSLSLMSRSFRPDLNEGINLVRRDIHDGYKEGSFDSIVSTYDAGSNIIRDSHDFGGPKVVTFANILKRETFPLSRILTDILKTLEEKMSNPIEIEFAVNIDPKNEIHSFHLLQVRPIVSGFESEEINISNIDSGNVIIRSYSSLGNGIIDDVHDLIYIVPDRFNPAKTREIAAEIKDLNKGFISKKKNYILIGPGRWGTSDPFLGIPVRWEDVSQASVIVEAGQKDFIVQQSQGSHFFHNITTFGIFYFSINPFLRDGFYDLEYLAQLKPVYESEFLRQISFKCPIITKTDGKNGHGVILKPEKT